MPKKLVHGVGITDISTKTNSTTDREYKLWVGILARCYSEKWLSKHPSYIGCSVSDNWLVYSIFKKDISGVIGFNQDGWQIDKDIIKKGNKIYSRENCAFVPESLNKILPSCKRSRGIYPVGVARMRGRNVNAFESKCNDGTGKRVHLGCYGDEITAFNAYKIFKENLIKSKAIELKDLIDIRVYDSLMSYEVEITD